MVVIWHLPTWHQCSNICRRYPTLWHVAEATSGASSSTPNAGYVGGLRLPVSKTPQYYRIWFTHIRFLHGIWCKTRAVDEQVLDMLRLVEIINDNSSRSAACWVYQRLSNWLRMDPGMRDMGYGHVWTSVEPLFLGKIEDIEDDDPKSSKVNFGTGIPSRSDGRAAAGFRGLALPHLLIYSVITATVPRGWRIALWSDSQVEWRGSLPKYVQKTLDKMQSVFMANVECQSTQIFFFVTDFEGREEAT